MPVRCAFQGQGGLQHRWFAARHAGDRMGTTLFKAYPRLSIAITPLFLRLFGYEKQPVSSSKRWVLRQEVCKLWSPLCHPRVPDQAHKTNRPPQPFLTDLPDVAHCRGKQNGMVSVTVAVQRHWQVKMPVPGLHSERSLGTLNGGGITAALTTDRSSDRAAMVVGQSAAGNRPPTQRRKMPDGNQKFGSPNHVCVFDLPFLPAAGLI